MVLRPLQRQVSILLTATLTVLNGSNMASSYISQKGQCQQSSQNVKLTSKWDWLDSSESQMIYSLLVAYTGCLAPRNHSSSQSHLKLSIVHLFRTPPSLRAFNLLLPSVLRQNSLINLEYWRKEHLYHRVPMAAFRFPSSHSLGSLFSEDPQGFHIITVPCSTFRKVSIGGM